MIKVSEYDQEIPQSGNHRLTTNQQHHEEEPQTLCRRKCHVNPHKIETCFRVFPKFKLINVPHLYLT